MRIDCNKCLAAYSYCKASSVLRLHVYAQAPLKQAHATAELTVVCSTSKQQGI